MRKYNAEAYHRKRRSDAIARGMCSRCTKRPAVQGGRQCEHCRRVDRERAVAIRANDPLARQAHRDNERRRRGDEPCQLTGREHVRSRLDRARVVGTTVDRAHILPRAVCTKDQANDPANVIRLCAEAHRLFDGSWILFAHDGRCLVDHRLPESIAKDYRDKRVAGYTKANDRYMSVRRAMAIGAGFSSVAQYSDTHAE